MKARVDEQRHIVLVDDDPAAVGLNPGDRLDLTFTKTGTHRPRRKVRGLWKGTHTPASVIDEVRREMNAALVDDGD
jgi:hypothetical protein